MTLHSFSDSHPQNLPFKSFEKVLPFQLDSNHEVNLASECGTTTLQYEGMCRRRKLQTWKGVSSSPSSLFSSTPILAILVLLANMGTGSYVWQYSVWPNFHVCTTGGLLARSSNNGLKSHQRAILYCQKCIQFSCFMFTFLEMKA